MAKTKLTPNEMRYCLYRHQGMTQRIAYRKAYNNYTAKDTTADSEACRLEAQPKITARLAELAQIAAEAANVREDTVIHGLVREATNAKSDGARVQAWQALAKILGINTQDRPVSDLSDDEIEQELREAGIHRDKTDTQGDTLH